jgi:lysophospholipase L1-like esterase
LRYARGRNDRVLVLSIPDWGVTPFVKTTTALPQTIAIELDAYNAAAQVVCEAHGVTFVDITPVSRERGGEAEMLAGDGLHPSAAMYELWTALALPAARTLLQH